MYEKIHSQTRKKQKGKILHAVDACHADVNWSESRDWCPNISSLIRTNQHRQTCLIHRE